MGTSVKNILDLVVIRFVIMAIEHSFGDLGILEQCKKLQYEWDVHELSVWVTIWLKTSLLAIWTGLLFVMRSNEAAA